MTGTADIRHYRGHIPCDCGSDAHDPETGFCSSCDPVLYRVVAYPDNWFEDHTVPTKSAVTGARKLPIIIDRLARETGRPVEVYLV